MQKKKRRKTNKRVAVIKICTKETIQRKKDHVVVAPTSKCHKCWNIFTLSPIDTFSPYAKPHKQTDKILFHYHTTHNTLWSSAHKQTQRLYSSSGWYCGSQLVLTQRPRPRGFAGPGKPDEGGFKVKIKQKKKSAWKKSSTDTTKKIPPDPCANSFPALDEIWNDCRRPLMTLRNCLSVQAHSENVRHLADLFSPHRPGNWLTLLSQIPVPPHPPQLPLQHPKRTNPLDSRTRKADGMGILWFTVTDS